MRITVLVLFLFLSKSFFPQKSYSFGNSSSNCHTRYVKFAPDDSYNIKGPTVFIVGAQGLSPMNMFEQDSLRFIEEFKDYLFVYIPKSPGSNDESLSCFKTIVNYLTDNVVNGKHNMFLQIQDNAYTSEALDLNGLSNMFSIIRFGKDINSEIGESSNTIANVKEVFKKVSTAQARLERNTDSQLDKYNGAPENFDFTLTGILKDAMTGESLPFANISVKGSTIGTNTNMDGYFILNGVPSDTSSVLIRYLGYKQTEIHLNPQLPKVDLVIDVEPSAFTLEEVIVKGEREDLVQFDDLGVSVIKMTPKKLEQLPNLGEKDVMRAFQLNPGVSASHESSSGLYVRGGTPDQNLITYDGFTIYHVDHLYGFFSAFNSNALKDVQLYKGGFESKFGGRLSSVTEITGKDGNSNDFNIGGNISLLSYGLFTEIPIGEKFTSIITFRKSYKGFIYNTLFDRFTDETETTDQVVDPGGGGRGGRGGFGGQETSVTSYFYDLNGKFTYRPNDKDIISLSVFNGTDNLDNGFDLEAPPRLASQATDFSLSLTDYTRYGNLASGLKWSRKWSPKIYSNTNVSFSNYFSDRVFSRSGGINFGNDSTVINTGTYENNDLKDYSAKTDWSWIPTKKVKIEGGLFGTLYDINYTYANNEDSPILDREDDGVIVGGYLQGTFKLMKDRLEVTPGIRNTYFDGTDKTYLEPRASFSYNLTPKLKFKGAYGDYYQYANRVVREDISTGSRDFWILSDGVDVPVSFARHFITGLSYDAQNYYFSAELYHKDLEGTTEYSLRFDPGRPGAETTFDENFFNGSGYSKGIELLAQKKYGKFNGWVSYTLSETKNLFDIYSDDYFYASQDATHEFKAVGMHKRKRWDFSATFIFATGRPYTAPSGAYDVTLLDGTTTEYFTVSSKNSLRLPDYHRVDLSANYKLLRESGKKFMGERDKVEAGSIGFSIFNVYNRANTWYNQYEIIEGEISETRVNYLGFMPNLSLTWKLR